MEEKTREEIARENMYIELDILKRNQQKLSKEELRSKYKSAYVKLLNECGKVVIRYLFENGVAYLYCKTKEQQTLINQYAVEQVKGAVDEIAVSLKSSNFEKFEELAEEIRASVVTYWADLTSMAELA